MATASATTGGQAQPTAPATSGDFYEVIAPGTGNVSYVDGNGNPLSADAVYTTGPYIPDSGAATSINPGWTFGGYKTTPTGAVQETNQQLTAADNSWLAGTGVTATTPHGDDTFFGTNPLAGILLPLAAFAAPALIAAVGAGAGSALTGTDALGALGAGGGAAGTDAVTDALTAGFNSGTAAAGAGGIQVAGDAAGIGAASGAGDLGTELAGATAYGGGAAATTPLAGDLGAELAGGTSYGAGGLAPAASGTAAGAAADAYDPTLSGLAGNNNLPAITSANSGVGASSLIPGVTNNTLASVAGNLGGALIKSNAAGNAATDISNAANTASAAAAATEANQQALLKPWYDTGAAALSQLNTGLQAGGQFNTPYTLASFETGPQSGLYNFANAQAQEAEKSALNASGQGTTTNAVTGAGNLASNLAASYYNTGFNENQAANAQTIQGLESEAGLGLSATNTANADTASLGTSLGNAATTAGNAAAAGQVASGSAWANTLGNTLNNAITSNTLASIFS